MKGAAPVPVGNIVLVGFMGSGKTEVGRLLADKTGRSLVDVDTTVEAEGLSIQEIFAAEGEKGFRARERRSIERVSRTRNAVIATGGGAVLDPANVRALKRSGVVVYLKVSTDELIDRLKGTTSRPLLSSREGPPTPAELKRRVSALLAQRTPLYEGAADHVVSCDGRDPGEVADEIVRRLSRNGAGTRPRRVRVPVDPPYSVFVGRGLLSRTGELVKLPRTAEKICLVSHPRIRRLWGQGLERSLRESGRDVVWWTFAEGEERKTIDTAGRLSRALGRAGMHRTDLLVALGGGVVGDLAGYVASTYARGIGFVQAPTTLLAMVDAAIGGKTGVNLSQGKNLVGTFHQPLGVVSDLDVLATLSERELRGGLAEVAKYSFIADPPLGRLLLRRREEIAARGPSLEEIVVRCARLKARIVAADPRDEGVRAILNYGHTLGHAIEDISAGGRVRGGGPRLHHGEAVSVGMVYAAAVAKLAGWTDGDLVTEHRRVLEALGLPTTVEGIGWSDVRERMRMDKKYARGVRLVVLTAPGRPVLRRVSEKILGQAWPEVAA